MELPHQWPWYATDHRDGPAAADRGSRAAGHGAVRARRYRATRVRRGRGSNLVGSRARGRRTRCSSESIPRSFEPSGTTWLRDGDTVRGAGCRHGPRSPGRHVREARGRHGPRKPGDAPRAQRPGAHRAAQTVPLDWNHRESGYQGTSVAIEARKSESRGWIRIRRQGRRRQPDAGNRSIPPVQSNTTTWRRPSPARRRSNAPSRSSRPIRRSISRSTGSRPARCSAA